MTEDFRYWCNALLKRVYWSIVILLITNILVMSEDSTFYSSNKIALPVSAPHLKLQQNYPTPQNDDHRNPCTVGTDCLKLNADCLKCSLNYSCVYGEVTEATCMLLHSDTPCKGDRHFKRRFTCRYCYQTDPWEHICSGVSECNARAAPPQVYRANCTVHSDILCLGHRSFPKNLPCRWTSGTSWSTALILSITLGGFGADRFYLGHWQEGIGKLFSFGGLGVWTIIDVVLIATRYLGPADGSLYVW